MWGSNRYRYLCGWIALPQPRSSRAMAADTRKGVGTPSSASFFARARTDVMPAIGAGTVEAVEGVSR